MATAAAFHRRIGGEISGIVETFTSLHTNEFRLPSFFFFLLLIIFFFPFSRFFFRAVPMTVALDISLFGYVDYYLFIMIILSLKAVFFSLAMLNQKKQKQKQKNGTSVCGRLIFLAISGPINHVLCIGNEAETS